MKHFEAPDFSCLIFGTDFLKLMYINLLNNRVLKVSRVYRFMISLSRDAVKY